MVDVNVVSAQIKFDYMVVSLRISVMAISSFPLKTALPNFTSYYVINNHLPLKRKSLILWNLVVIFNTLSEYIKGQLFARVVFKIISQRPLNGLVIMILRHEEVFVPFNIKPHLSIAQSVLNNSTPSKHYSQYMIMVQPRYFCP